jgi:hypothetical protein
MILTPSKEFTITIAVNRRTRATHLWEDPYPLHYQLIDVMESQILQGMGKLFSISGW